MALFGLIGYPLGHSFSKRYFTEKFEREKLDGYAYELFPLESIALLPDLINENPSLHGLNVTIPYKTAVLPYLHGIHPEAAEIGAVNTIVIKNYRLYGFNTDVYGFASSLKKALDARVQPVSGALILGTGGASKAVAFVLKKLEIPFSFVSRASKPGVLSYEELTENIVSSNELIINTTPLGMQPKIDDLPPIPFQYVGEKHLLYDLIYNPEQTAFMKNGMGKGAHVINGLEMLYLQADKAWQWWNEPEVESFLR